MTQAEMIYKYNNQFRPSFNRNLFIRSDDHLIEALRKVIYSCERNSTFVIKVLDFKVIDGYDDINHVLFEYEESLINKNKNGTTPETPKKSSAKKRDNPYSYINLNDSDLKLIQVTYFIQITEKKNGLVSDTVTVYIAIPRIVDDFYYRLNGNTYSAMYQIVDASTYNNSASKNAKKQSITFKTIFTPIRVYRYSSSVIDITGKAIPASYFVVNMFKKSVLLMKYLLAKFGFSFCAEFLNLKNMWLLDDISNIDQDIYYIFPIRDMFVVCPRMEYDSIQICQSFVYTAISVINYMADHKYQDFFDHKTFVKALGAEFTSKDITTIYDKGLNILWSTEFVYDQITKDDLKLPIDDKDDVYRVLRWMMYEFNALRRKDNLDISTKKVRYAEYLASYYATKLFLGICRVSDKGERAGLDTIRKAIQISPMYLINVITKCELVNYKNCVNDLDSLFALKYTYKGVSGIGEKSNAISMAYRSIHPSHLGRVDIDSSSNSEPGVSGTICPLAELYDNHFTEYEEPSSWRSQVCAVIDKFRALESKRTLYTLINKASNTEVHSVQEQNMLNECTEAASRLIVFPLEEDANEEYIDGFDIFGDGYFFWLREEI